MADEIDHIAQLQKHLYARDPESIPKRKFGILRPVKQRVDSTWGSTEIPKAQHQYAASTIAFRRFFVISLLFFLVGAGAAAFSFFRGAATLSSKNVDVNILGNAFIGGGEELPLQVEVVNKNSSDLTSVRLTIEYPKGASDGTGDTAYIEREVGVVGSGKSKSESFSVMLYGEQGATRTITATVEYRLTGASAIFQKKQLFPVIINSSPLKLTVDGPVAVAPGQPFLLTIRNLFTGDKVLGTLLARVEYPSGFIFDSAIPAPIAGNNVWALGSLARGVENTVIIKGKIAGEEGDEKAFRVYTGTPTSDIDNTIAVTYNSALHQVRLGSPFITAQIAIGGSNETVAAVVRDSMVYGTVVWKNASANTIVNPVFTVQFSGADIDPESVSAGDGVYNQLSRTITWSGSAVNSILSIEPGQSGQFPFSVKARANSSGDIVANLSVAGTLREQGIDQLIPNLDSKTIRFTSRLQFAAASLYSVGPFKNTGPLPPQAGKETTYTITWTLQPSDNPLGNIQVSAVLAPGVMWGGSISPQAESITFIPETNTVTWSAGSLPRATTAAQYKTVSFKVKVRPTASQVGVQLPLVGDSTVTAFDTVANVPLTATRPAVSTRLDTDPAYSPGDEKVLP